MQSEINSLQRRGTWKVVERPASVKPVDCRWVYKVKWSADRSEVKLKSRLVARGFSQEYGVNYFDTYAPVVKSSSVRLLFAVAVECGLKVQQIDVKNAYVNSVLEEEVYMEQPKGFEFQDKSKYVLKLQRSLYGLKQSGNEWNKCLNNVLTNKMCFRRLVSESCIYVRGSEKDMVILAVYVDDILLFASSNKIIENVKNEIKAEFEIDDIGQCRKVIGMHVNCGDNYIELSQKPLIEELVSMAKLKECKISRSPIESGQRMMRCTQEANKKRKKQGNIEAEREQCGIVCGTEYRGLTGKLNYLASTTRPDLIHSMSYLSQFNQCPHPEHLSAVRRVIRYLAGTTDRGIRYEKSTKDAMIVTYVDADWAQCPNDRRSYTGYISMLCGGAISWEAKKQPTVALSSTEAEYMALTSAAKEAMFIKNVLTELGLQAIFKGEPLEIKCDNKGAIELGKNNGYSPRTKHIDVRHHYIRKLVEKKQVKVNYIDTSSNLADICTKPLGPLVHERITKEIVHICK